MRDVDGERGKTGGLPVGGLGADALDDLPLLISHIGPDLRYRFMNRAYEFWFGHARETMLGRTMAEVLGPAAFKALEPRIRLVLGGQPIRFEIQAPYRDGGTRDIVAHYVPAEAGGFYALVEDVSVVRRTERRAQAILTALPDPFISLDADLTVTFANPASLTFLPAGALRVGQSLAGRLPPEREALLHKVLTTQDPLEMEMTSAVRPDRTLHMRIFPLDGGLGVHARDVTENRRMVRELADRERRLSVAADAVLGVAYDWDLTRDVVVRSAGLKHLLGVGPEDADPSPDWWRARVHPEDLECILAGKGEEHSVEWSEQEYRVRHEDGRWIDVIDRARVLFDADGRPARVIGTTIDVTALKQGEARLRVLVDEVNHRVKNTLATVQSIALLSARSCPDVETYVERFQDRLASLSRAHDLLTRRHWTDATLSEVIEAALRPYDGAGRRMRSEGPAVVLTSRQALALSMAFHELATNAVKYGALASQDGAVAISWGLVDGQVALVWKEHDGPAVRPPERTGFGSRLLRSVAVDLSGKVVVDYPTDGLACRIVFPL